MATSAAVTALTGEPAPVRRGGRRAGQAGALVLAASFVAAFALYTRHADMPFYYHSDEPSKVEQVTGERTLNFKHPLLLMNATRALAFATGCGRRAPVGGARRPHRVGGLRAPGRSRRSPRSRGSRAARSAARVRRAGGAALPRPLHVRALHERGHARSRSGFGGAAGCERLRAAARRRGGRRPRRRVRARDLGEVRGRGGARLRAAAASGSACAARRGPALRGPRGLRAAGLAVPRSS